MELLKKLPTRKQGPTQYIASWGLFYCPYCKQDVERDLGAGRQQVSCGCHKTKNVRHGYTSNGVMHPLYAAWQSMKARCYNPHEKRYPHYGGRGIQICDEWHTPEIFIAWGLNHGWQKGLQLDRINNDGHYEPANCRFVTCTINNRNRSVTKLNLETARRIRSLYAQGTWTQQELADVYNVSRSTIGFIIQGQRWKETQPGG
jgi:DNA-binding XRE family transcriptional regulator